MDPTDPLHSQMLTVSKFLDALRVTLHIEFWDDHVS